MEGKNDETAGVGGGCPCMNRAGAGTGQRRATADLSRGERQSGVVVSGESEDLRARGQTGTVVRHG